ncbi:MAG: hypothetical protein EGQ16_00630 [Clostridiales bacterium]|nr:hypothetical protein [Clostridiales bacterium]
MNTFAEYILEEQDLAAKMEIVYYLSKKSKIFFDKSVVFKTEIARMFLNYAKLDIDKNLILTACLLCNVKKINNAQDIESVHTYAKKGAEYLSGLGFNKRFCKICEEVNRYSGSNPRERESDILELVEQFGGMLLDRPERIGFKPDEALVLLEHRNLKDTYNRYLDIFMDFVNFLEKINMSELTSMPALRRLVKIHNETTSIIDFIKEVVYNYEPKIDKLTAKQMNKLSKEMFEDLENPNRPLFSEEAAQRVMRHINEETIKIKE